LNDSIAYKFSWINDLKTILSSFDWSEKTGGIDNIHAVLPIVGDVTIVNFQYLNDHSVWIKGLSSAFVYFLICVYVVRTAPSLLGYMH